MSRVEIDCKIMIAEEIAAAIPGYRIVQPLTRLMYQNIYYLESIAAMTERVQKWAAIDERTAMVLCGKCVLIAALRLGSKSAQAMCNRQAFLNAAIIAEVDKQMLAEPEYNWFVPMTDLHAMAYMPKLLS